MCHQSICHFTCDFPEDSVASLKASLETTNPLHWTALTWAALRGRCDTTRHWALYSCDVRCSIFGCCACGCRCCCGGGRSRCPHSFLQFCRWYQWPSKLIQGQKYQVSFYDAVMREIQWNDLPEGRKIPWKSHTRTLVYMLVCYPLPITVAIRTIVLSSGSPEILHFFTSQVLGGASHCTLL